MYKFLKFSWITAFPFSILGYEVKQKRESPCTSLKRPQPTSDRPDENFAGNISNKKNRNERATLSRYLYP